MTDSPAVAAGGRRAESNARGRFPLVACMTSIAATSLGLAAAVLDIRWGTGHQSGDALSLSWLYVGFAWMLTWLVAWPAITGAPGRRELFHDWLGLLIGAIPAVGMAALFSEATRAMIGAMLALQLGMSLFAMGLLAWAGGGNVRVRSSLAAGLLVALGIITPVFASLQRDFFPRAWSGWFDAVPLLVWARAARHEEEWLAIAWPVWWVAGGAAVLGLLLLWLNPEPRPASPQPAQ